MNKATLRKNLLSDLSNIESQIQEIDHHIECYDAIFSDGDEFPYSKEDLKGSLSTLRDIQKKLNKELKELERI